MTINILYLLNIDWNAFYDRLSKVLEQHMAPTAVP